MPSLFWLIFSVFAAAVYVTTWLLLFVHRDDPQALRALVYPNSTEAQELRRRASARVAAGGDSRASFGDWQCRTPTTPSSLCGADSILGDAGFFPSALTLRSATAKAATALLVASQLQVGGASSPPRTPTPRSRSAANELEASVAQQRRRSRSGSYLRRAVSSGRPSRVSETRSLWMGSAGEDGGMVEAITEAAASMAKHSMPVHVCGSGDRLITYAAGITLGNGAVMCRVNDSAAFATKKMGEIVEFEAGEGGAGESSFHHAMLQLEGDVLTAEEECNRLRRNIAFISAARQELRIEAELLRSTTSSNSYSSCCTSASSGGSSEDMEMAEDVAAQGDAQEITVVPFAEMADEKGFADTNKQKESEAQPTLWQINAERPVTYAE